MNAHIFEDALSFLKQVHALISQHKKYFRKKTCTYIRTRNDFDNKKNEKYFNIKKIKRYILLDHKKSNIDKKDLQYYGLSCLSYSIHVNVTLRPCCCDTDVRYIYWYRITSISYMKLCFHTFKRYPDLRCQIKIDLVSCIFS